MPERNYDAGRSISTLKLMREIYGGPNAAHMPAALGGISMLAMMQYYYSAEDRYVAARVAHGRVGQIFNPDPFPLMKVELELLIYCIKRCLDIIVQSAYTHCYHERVQKNGSIDLDSIGRVLAADPASDRHKDLLQKLLPANEDGARNREFFGVVNSLANNFKHGYFSPETFTTFSPDYPCIVVFETDNRDVRKVSMVHNHNAGHILMGFQDTVNRLLVEFGSKPLF